MFKNIFKNKTRLVFLIITMYLLIFPVIGMIMAGNYQMENIDHLDNKLINIPNDKDSAQLILSNELNYRIFDPELNEYLSNLKLNKKLQNSIDLIILFQNGISAKDRVNLLNSVFDNYEIKKNYDIISGMHISIYAEQLIEKYDDIF